MHNILAKNSDLWFTLGLLKRWIGKLCIVYYLASDIGKPHNLTPLFVYTFTFGKSTDTDLVNYS